MNELALFAGAGGGILGGHLLGWRTVCAVEMGKPTQQAYLSQDKMTKYSRLSRFGMMFKPLTENLGEELLMSYLEDFHAKTSQSQEKENGLDGERSRNVARDGKDY